MVPSSNGRDGPQTDGPAAQNVYERPAARAGRNLGSGNVLGGANTPPELGRVYHATLKKERDPLR